VRVIPAEEDGRLAAVRRYDVLDTPPDGAFDRITSLAARLFQVPIAIVSIVDHDRIWFKSHHGIDVEQIDRAPGLCASAICQYEPWLVTDASVDPRTIDNALVAGELGLRFYLGVPLTTWDGYNLGTLNVIDVRPREVSDDDVDTLRDLASVVVDELELRLATRRAFQERRQRALELNDDIIQGLSVAKLALETGEHELARAAVANVLTVTRAIVSGLLEDSESEPLELGAGDFVRAAPSSLST